MLVGHRHVARDRGQIDLGKDLARRDALITVAMQRLDIKPTVPVDPDFAHPQTAIDLELVEQRTGDDYLDGDIGYVAIAVTTVALIGLEAPLFSSRRHVIDP
jgi:hypothetical protein